MVPLSTVSTRSFQSHLAGVRSLSLARDRLFGLVETLRTTKLGQFAEEPCSFLKKSFVANQIFYNHLTATPPEPLSSSFFNPSDLTIPFRSVSGTITDGDIPEDSIYRKLLACIPIIGAISTFFNERSLSAKIMCSYDPDRIVRLINVKNDYKIASIIRELLSLTTIVTRVALSHLSLSVGIGTGIALIGCIAFHAYGIYKNKQITDLASCRVIGLK